MTLEEIKAWLKENAANPDVVAYMQGLAVPNIDAVKTYLDATAEGKAFLTAEKDKHFNKGLETWKTNNLQTLIDDGVAKANPAKTPEMQKIEALEKQLAEKDKAEKRQTLLNKALEVAAEKKLPTKLVQRFLDEDEEKTLAALAEFETELNTAIQTGVDAAFKGNGYQPGKGTDKNDKPMNIGALVKENQLRQD